MDIKELIIMYAPTVFMALSVIMNYVKTFKALSTNVSKIENSQKLKKMDKTMADLQFEIVSRSRYITELTAANEILIRRIEELNKRLDAYGMLESMLEKDVTGEFLNKFKKLFNPFAGPELNTLFITGDGDGY